MLVAQDLNGTRRGRALAPLEVWRVQGGTDPIWTQAIDAGLDTTLLVREAARAAPPRLADGLLRWAESIKGAASDVVAGVCRDADEEAMWGNIHKWLGCWRLNPQEPSRPPRADTSGDESDPPPARSEPPGKGG
jgi:hypothetical protein